MRKASTACCRSLRFERRQATDLRTLDWTWFRQGCDDGLVERRRRIEWDRAATRRVRRLWGVDLHPSRLLVYLVAAGLKASFLWAPARRQAARIVLRTNIVKSTRLPAAFHGLRILQLSDLHADLSGDALIEVTRLVAALDYDLCVVTGDYRGDTTGPFDEAMAAMASVCAVIHRPTVAVLGNHDSIDMREPLKAMGVEVLMNQAARLGLNGEAIYLAGVDDAHLYGTHDLRAALDAVPPEGFSILLSHTPELWSEAAEAGVDLMLSGHTHGGQLCLPGGVPVVLAATLPRRFARGAWQHRAMQGYTSVGCGTSGLAVRLNCPPEITLHVLEHALAT